MRYLFSIVFSLVTTFLLAQESMPTAQQVREMINGSVYALKVPPQEVASVSEQVIGNGSDSATLRIYKPKAEGKLPVVYFIHGGAWIAGNLNTHDNVCRVMANRLKAIVVSVGYRQPPEYKFPVSTNDTYFGFRWVAEHLKELGGNGKLIVMGDSAGGQLTAVVCQLNAAGKKPVAVTAQVLINPALDLRRGSPTDTTYGMFIAWGTKPTEDLSDTRLSPLAAKDFSKLPPAVIVVGEQDEIRDDGINYDKQLKAAGIASSLYTQPKTGHLGPLFCAAHSKAQPAIDFIVTTLNATYLPK